MICQHCKANTVKTYGSKVCSLKCATEAMGENYEIVEARLKSEIELQKFISNKAKVKQ